MTSDRAERVMRCPVCGVHRDANPPDNPGIPHSPACPNTSTSTPPCSPPARWWVLLLTRRLRLRPTKERPAMPETSDHTESVRLTEGERQALHKALGNDVSDYLREWIVFPAVEAILTARLAEAEDRFVRAEAQVAVVRNLGDRICAVVASDEHES